MRSLVKRTALSLVFSVVYLRNYRHIPRIKEVSKCRRWFTCQSKRRRWWSPSRPPDWRGRHTPLSSVWHPPCPLGWGDGLPPSPPPPPSFSILCLFLWKLNFALHRIGLEGSILFCPQPVCPRTKSLGWLVPWTRFQWKMRPLEDAYLGQGVPRMMRLLDDVSL